MCIPLPSCPQCPPPATAWASSTWPLWLSRCARSPCRPINGPRRPCQGACPIGNLGQAGNTSPSWVSPTRSTRRIVFLIFTLVMGGDWSSLVKMSRNQFRLKRTTWVENYICGIVFDSPLSIWYTRSTGYSMLQSIVRNRDSPLPSFSLFIYS